jgi:Ca2+-binding RTX toxin-like protein
MPSFSVLDLNTGTNAITDGTPGAVAPPPVNSAGQPLTNQLVSTTPDSVSVTALVPNVYIATGVGNDFINLSFLNGSNLVDGGSGTNSIIGGTGNDTFNMVGPNLTANAFDVISGFHPGDVANVIGIAPGSFSLSEIPGVGLVIDNKTPAGADLRLLIGGSPTGSLNVGFGTSPVFGTFMSVTET